MTYFIHDFSPLPFFHSDTLLEKYFSKYFQHVALFCLSPRHFVEKQLFSSKNTNPNLKFTIKFLEGGNIFKTDPNLEKAVIAEYMLVKRKKS